MFSRFEKKQTERGSNSYEEYGNDKTYGGVQAELQQADREDRGDQQAASVTGAAGRVY